MKTTLIINGMNIDVLLGKYVLDIDNWANGLDKDSISEYLENTYYKQLTRRINNIPNKDTFIKTIIEHFFEQHPVWEYFCKIDFDSILHKELPGYIKTFKKELVTMTNYLIEDVKIVKWYMSSYGSILDLKLTCDAKDYDLDKLTKKVIKIYASSNNPITVYGFPTSIYKVAVETIHEDRELFKSVLKGNKSSRVSYKDAESFVTAWVDDKVTNEEFIEQFINLLFAIRRIDVTEFYQDFFINVMSKVEMKIIKLIKPDFEKFFAQLLD